MRLNHEELTFQGHMNKTPALPQERIGRNTVDGNRSSIHSFAIHFKHLFSFRDQRESLPFHFTLRTLLIATTLIAVMLGLIVWAVR
jgi:hypothetical protein